MMWKLVDLSFFLKLTLDILSPVMENAYNIVLLNLD